MLSNHAQRFLECTCWSKGIVMKCERGTIARLGWPAMTCVCETARSAGWWYHGGHLGGRVDASSHFRWFPGFCLRPPFVFQTTCCHPSPSCRCCLLRDLSSFQSRSNRQSQQSVGNSAAAALALLVADSSGAGRGRLHCSTGDGAPSSHRQPNPPSCAHLGPWQL